MSFTSGAPQNRRIGIALVNLTLLLGLGALALRADRWWLILLTGFQLVSVLTHLRRDAGDFG